MAATTLMEALAKGTALDAHALRAAMEAAFGASDAAGAWDWKLAYEACEAAQIPRRGQKAQRRRSRRRLQRFRSASQSHRII